MGRFADALAAPGLAAIAEVKRRSPSAGDLRPDADPARLAAQFAKAGAGAISILVDERFGGSIDDLRAARAATAVPLLAKGFFTQELQLLQLKVAGADAALLILRDLDDARAAALLGADAVLVGSALMRADDPAAKLEQLLSRPLVKVCGMTRQEDVDAALEAGADLVGFILAEETPRRAPGVLDVPETALAVAVFVGEPRETGREPDLVQLYARD